MILILKQKTILLDTSPPKTTLNPLVRLVDAKLVPSAIVYYSGSSFLKPEVKTNLTDPAVANAQAVKSRYESLADRVLFGYRL